MAASKAYIAKLIFTGEQWLHAHAAIVEDGIITDVLPVSELDPVWRLHISAIAYWLLHL